MFSRSFNVFSRLNGALQTRSPQFESRSVAQSTVDVLG
jgi:hypothetical protein